MFREHKISKVKHDKKFRLKLEAAGPETNNFHHGMNITKVKNDTWCKIFPKANIQDKISINKLMRIDTSCDYIIVPFQPAKPWCKSPH